MICSEVQNGEFNLNFGFSLKQWVLMVETKSKTRKKIKENSLKHLATDFGF